MNTPHNSQLILNLGPRLDARLSDFAGANWTAVIAAIDDLLHGSSKNCFIYGEPNTGKTHLLAAVCEAYSQQGFSTVLLSLRELLASETPDCLECFENFTLIALDDIEVIDSHEDWQQALFNLLSRAKKNQTRILLAARMSPAELGLQLPSLTAQLSKAVFFHIPNGKDEADRHAILLAALSRRDLHLEPEVIQYLLHKGPSYTGLLLKHLSYIEEVALQQRKKLTLNFVKQLTEPL